MYQYLWHSEHFCAHIKCSMRVCWVNKRMTVVCGSLLVPTLSRGPGAAGRAFTWPQDPSSPSPHASLSCTWHREVSLLGLGVAEPTAADNKLTASCLLLCPQTPWLIMEPALAGCQPCPHPFLWSLLPLSHSLLSPQLGSQVTSPPTTWPDLGGRRLGGPNEAREVPSPPASHFVMTWWPGVKTQAATEGWVQAPSPSMHWGCGQAANRVPPAYQQCSHPPHGVCAPPTKQGLLVLNIRGGVSP